MRADRFVCSRFHRRITRFWHYLCSKGMLKGWSIIVFLACLVVTVFHIIVPLVLIPLMDVDPLR